MGDGLVWALWIISATAFVAGYMLRAYLQWLVNDELDAALRTRGLRVDYGKPVSLIAVESGGLPGAAGQET